MGSGIGYKCSKCGKRYSVCTGIGMMYPAVYEKLMKDIKEGKYGEEWKILSESEPNVAVDAERYLYICSKCPHWDVDYGLSLYAPNAPMTKDTDYVMPVDLKENYHLIKRRAHKCEKCGSDMHKARKGDKNDLPCPECGGVLVKGHVELIMWD